MISQPDSLPPMANLDRSYEEIIERLYEIYRKDFAEERAKYCRRDVAYNGVINEFSQSKVESFWHVITHDDPTKTNRLIDHRRTERLPWSKPLIEHPFHKEIKFFFYDECDSRKGIRHYIWFENESYLVILKRRKYDFYWITAFHVDDRKHAYFQRNFEKRIGP